MQAPRPCTTYRTVNWVLSQGGVQTTRGREVERKPGSLAQVDLSPHGLPVPVALSDGSEQKGSKTLQNRTHADKQNHSVA